MWRCWQAGAAFGRWPRASSPRLRDRSAMRLDCSSSGWAPAHSSRLSSPSRCGRSSPPPQPARLSRSPEARDSTDASAAAAMATPPTLPDLRRSALIADGKAWASVVHDGALRDRGMVSFANVLNPQQIEAIRHYVIKRANEDKALGDK